MSGSEPKPHLEDGQQLDRYEVVRFLARGGMSEVYVAVLKQPGFEREVVVKLMRPDLAQITEFRNRFSIEANILARKLNDQEGVVRVTDVGAVEILYEGSRLQVPYLVQDYLKGQGLDAGIAKGLTWSERREIAIATCKALVAIHAADVIHRDLKPSNIFILGGAAHRVRVLDFGIAKSLAPVAGAEGATALGQAIGTPAYMSPEQRRDSSRVERSSDIYSFGCVLFAMICGFSPNEDRNTRRTRKPRELVASTPPELDRLIASMLEESPADRPATVSDVLQRLTAIRWPSDGVKGPVDRSLAWIITTIVSGIAVVGVGVGLLLNYKSCSSSHPITDDGGSAQDVRAQDDVRPIDAPVDVIDAAVSLNDFVDIEPGNGSPIQATWVRGLVALPGLTSPTVAYAIQAHEVTWREWQQFSRASELPKPTTDTDDMPVRGVSYELAEAFCKALADPARLPTQAEWQWAATLRDDVRTYPWGDEPPDLRRMVFLGSAPLPFEAARTTQDIVTLPDGKKIYDLMGNVEEWTSSLLPQEHDDGTYRVTRGFSLMSVDQRAEREARLELGARGVSRLCATGDCPPPGLALKNIGFRCVRTQADEPEPDQPREPAQRDTATRRGHGTGVKK